MSSGPPALLIQVLTARLSTVFWGDGWDDYDRFFLRT